jgi:hypothetical protein
MNELDSDILTAKMKKKLHKKFFRKLKLFGFSCSYYKLALKDTFCYIDRLNKEIKLLEKLNQQHTADISYLHETFINELNENRKSCLKSIFKKTFYKNKISKIKILENLIKESEFYYMMQD